MKWTVRCGYLCCLLFALMWVCSCDQGGIPAEDSTPIPSDGTTTADEDSFMIVFDGEHSGSLTRDEGSAAKEYGLAKYSVSEVGWPAPRSLFVDFDVTISEGLQAKIESAGGITCVTAEDQGCDTHYRVWISPRVAVEDRVAVRDRIVEICENHSALRLTSGE